MPKIYNIEIRETGTTIFSHDIFSVQFNSIFYWKEHNRGVIQTTNIQLQYIININWK